MDIAKKLTTEPVETPEIKLETLQTLSYELIDKSVTLWRTYKDTAQGKGKKLDKAPAIHKMIIEAMRFHPDIMELGKLHDYEREVAVAYEAYLAGKAGLNKPETTGNEQHPTLTTPIAK